MTQQYKKKLIEVALPLEAINAASAREKSIRHGHPSTLHLWWARRPLAACRAVLFAQLVDDPSSHPDKFPTLADQETERKRLFTLIEDLVIWENSTNEEVLERARVEIRKSCDGDLPPVHDPFSGGGSIPLEAQRLGLPAYGSDLNPVAVMIGKAMIEIPPKFKDTKPVHPGGAEKLHYRNAEGLAEDVKHYGEWMRAKAFGRIGHLYPQVDLPQDKGGGKATVIAWIWARTVPSPDPAFSDVQVPIASSFLLSSKKGKETWVEPVVDKSAKTIFYRIHKGGTREDWARAKQGTKQGRGSFRCLMSDSAIPVSYVKEVGKAGKMEEHLIAIVAEGNRSRIYAAPNEEHIAIASTDEAKAIAQECREIFLSGETPAKLTGGTCHGYGLDQWGKLFTDRQLVALNMFSDLVQEAREQIDADARAAGLDADPAPLRDGGTGARAYAEAVSVYLAFGISKMTDRGSTICSWDSTRSNLRNTFGRQAIPMTWDFAEGNPFSGSTGNWGNCIEWGVKTLNAFILAAPGNETQQDAQTVTYPEKAVISTDPPYYDNIAYADLSDFFFCWMKPVIRPVYPDLFGVLATPKAEELVAAPYRHGGRDAAEKHFLDGMRTAIANMADQSSPEYPATIYYAFKQREIRDEGISSPGWATFLQAVIEAGYAVVGTWPLRTEMTNRLIASGTNALANSIVLVCRKKQASAEISSRAEFIRILRRELPLAIAALQTANIAPADMPQAAIGPGMGIFSHYKAVLESDDTPMNVKTALQLINRELDAFLKDVQGDFDPATGFAITWFEQNGLKAGNYGTANSIATARGISVESVRHAGIVEAAAGKVRLLKRDELPEDGDPVSDPRLTIWGYLHYLVRGHERDGVSFDTAVLLKKMGDKADAVKDLAYCLYDICATKRSDAKQATAYNALIADWSELTRDAANIHDTRGDGQKSLDL